MSAKVIYTLSEDKQEIQKQLGCMNGIFQLFDRRYLHGQRRHGHNHKQLPQGQSDNSKEFNNAPEKSKDKITKEKHRVSVESSRNSFSSSCSSLDCSKRVQTEPSSFCPSIVSEPSSPTSTKKQDFQIPQSNIKNVVKESMTRKPRGVSVKTVAKDERKGPTMTHIDSPRPLQHPKPVSYERKDQNLAKLREISNSRGVKDVKETSRFSYDNRESPYKLKSMANMEERPRLSLDSKQSSIKNLTNRVDQSQTNEPGSNKRPSSSVVARLMGLEITNEFIVDESVPVPISISPRKSVAPKIPNGLPRIPLEQAPWKQEVSKKQPAHKKVKARERPDHGGQSVYGQIERRLTDVEFKTSGKDLRALKQILEAIQRTQIRLEKTEHQPVSPAIKRPAVKPAINLRKVNKVNHTVEGRILRNSTLKTKKPVSPSNQVSCNARNSGNVSPRIQKSKNEINKQSVHGVKKQSNGQIRAVNRMQTNDHSSGYISHKRNTSQQSETLSFPSESDTSLTSQNEPDWTQENKHKFAERLMGYKPMAELAMLTMEQPSPVSVLDAFYTEDAPSPIQKKSYGFKDDEDLRFDEREWNQVGIDNLITTTQKNQSISEFSQIKFENIKHLVHQIELLNSISDEPINEDHIYIKEILLASGFMKNLDSATKIAHLHPTGTLINPELFNILEETKEFTSKSEKMKRKMIFDNVNNILMEKVIKSASSEMWASKRKWRIMNGEKLLEELWLEINNLEDNASSGLYDEIINIVNEDVNKQSEDWNDKESSEVSGLVLDIERLIFKDLISEIVNAEVAGPRDGHGRHRRQLFLM